jgi:dolichol-phosphate mannosyltransferase
MPHISVVIPVYQGEDCLDELYRRLKASLEKITSDFEIILVDDFSHDRSWQKITELGANDTRIKGLRFSRNFGQHYGITAGIDICDGEWVCVMDCDLQDQPEEIPALYKKAQEGFDVVLARRAFRQDPYFKRWTSKLFYRVFSYLAEVDYDGSIGNFRLVSRSVIESFRQMREKLRFFGALMQWLGYSAATIDVTHGARFAGKSTYSFTKLYRLAAETILAFSDKPLRLAVKIGFLVSLGSVLFGIYIIMLNAIDGVPIIGWSSLIVSIYFMSGIIMSTLGLVGIYIGKVFDEVKRRPLYVVQHTVNLRD